jgi:hypothetical protein
MIPFTVYDRIMAYLREQILPESIICETEVFMILYKTLFFVPYFYTDNRQFTAD